MFELKNSQIFGIFFKTKCNFVYNKKLGINKKSAENELKKVGTKKWSADEKCKQKRTRKE